MPRATNETKSTTRRAADSTNTIITSPRRRIASHLHAVSDRRFIAQPQIAHETMDIDSSDGDLSPRIASAPPVGPAPHVTPPLAVPPVLTHAPMRTVHLTHEQFDHAVKFMYLMERLCCIRGTISRRCSDWHRLLCKHMFIAFPTAEMSIQEWSTWFSEHEDEMWRRLDVLRSDRCSVVFEVRYD